MPTVRADAGAVARRRVGTAASRTLLLMHDGELADVRLLAESAGATVIECRPGETPPAWDVLVASGRYAKRELPRGGREHAVRIAVLDRNMRSLRALVRRAGVDLVVRRPVHPAALRLLLLHSLYRGPERRSRRVVVGTPVRFRAGLLRKDGLLTDLSLRGCQIVSRHALRPGQSLVVWVPDAAQEGKTFGVRGTVVRCFQAAGGERGYGVDFGVVAKHVASQLKLAVNAHLDGPAVGKTIDAGVTQPMAPRSPADPTPSADVANAEADSDSGSGAERRRAERREYSGRRVVALGEEAARVLIGRDLSIGGMRVDRAPNLAVGQRFQVALHIAPGQTPLVVGAEILRDDGDRGLAVRFMDVDATAAGYLSKMVDSLPMLADGEGVVVSEIVDPNA
jgi:hypothetical protein